MSARVEIPRIPKERRCLMCKQVKDASCFYAYRYKTNQGKISVRLDGRCKGCSPKHRNQRDHEKEVLRCRTYRQKNAEKVKQQVADYRRENRQSVLISRRSSEARRRALGYSAKCADARQPIEQCLELARFGNLYLDAYDGSLIENPTIDHVTPLHLQGPHCLENLAVTSRANNISKSRLPLSIWMLRRRRMLECRSTS